MTDRAYLFLVLSAALAGCAGVKQSSASGSAGSGGTSQTGTAGRPNITGAGGSSVVPEPCVGKCTDFPPDPQFDLGVSRDVTGMFGAPTGAAGPCVTEPENGTLFPNNWLRPRVRVPGSTGVIKITFHAEKQANDLVAYTTSDSWAMPKDIWMGLARHVVEEDVTVTVQTPSGGTTMTKFQIAPVGAGGSMVFWAANPAAAGKVGVENMPQDAIVNDSMLLGFTVGDETTIETLNIKNVQQQVALQDGKTQGSHCIGCHTGTPDGDYVAFVDAWPWGAAFAGVNPGMTGKALPGYLGGTCTNWNTCDAPKTFVQYPWNGPMTFSAARWTPTEKLAIIATQVQDITTPWGVGTPNWQPGRLAWVDLNSTATTTTNGQVNPTRGVAFDYLTRTGDSNAAAFPTWSRDGNTIVYVSVACPNPGATNGCGTQDGRLYKGAADLYQVPFGNKAGGAATPVPGASTPGAEEYYPAFSPDDRLIAFTRVPAGDEMFANPGAEMWVVPFQPGAVGAVAKRMAANDPPSCSGKMSPGVNNHWPKWSPTRTTVGNRTYYWLIFSSNRYGLPPVTTSSGGQSKIVQVSQLYVTAVVADEVSITTYPAIYLWNQPQNRLNTTPAWENFNIPIIVD